MANSTRNATVPVCDRASTNLMTIAKRLTSTKRQVGTEQTLLPKGHCTNRQVAEEVRDNPPILAESSLLEGDPQPGAVHQDERGVEVGVGGDGLEVARVGRRAVHVVGEDQAAGAAPGEQFLEVAA